VRQASESRVVLRPVSPDEVSPEVPASPEGTAGAHFLGLAAHSAAALASMSAQLRAAAEMRLAPRIRQAIALRVSELNGCARSPCVAIDGAAPLDAAATRRYRLGLAHDPKEQVLLALTTKLVLERGHHTRCAVEAARQLGAGDEEIVEVVALVGLHTFANYLDSVAG